MPQPNPLLKYINNGKVSEPTRVPVVHAAHQINLVPPKMLVRGWIPCGAVTLLVGAPGSGKGIVAADVVARGSRGDAMPNGDRIVGAFTSWIVCGPGEDTEADWQLRLTAANADPSRYRVVPHVVDELGYRVAVTSADLEGIIGMAAAVGARLVLIDSLGAMAGTVNLDTVEARQKILDPLGRAADVHGVAVVLIHHDRKSGGDPLDMVANSRQITASARSVLTIVRERESEDGSRFLSVAKLNGSKKADPIAFTTAGRSITTDDGTKMRDDRGDIVFVPVVQWSDRHVTEQDVNAAANNVVQVRDDAADTLRELLAGGPLRSVELENEMQAAGYTRDQFKRTRQRIGAGVVKVSHGMSAGWWTLPPGMPKQEGREVIERGEV